ncbi:MAG: hypothetical protein JST26_08110 [Bacteroidetes bacterium]|nr:hypothetical protein [Bacteroidota bacterium]
MIRASPTGYFSSLCVFCGVVFFISCDRTNSQTKTTFNMDTISVTRSMNDLGMPIDTLERRVLQAGDTLAYDQLMIELLDYSIEERIKWSKIMADKYHYIPAYTDYLQQLLMKSSHNWRELTQGEKDTAILFINQAVMHGDSLAVELKKEFGLQ